MSHSNSREQRLVRAEDGERGSALLIVLVFAAIIAISLYAELPIVTFESQREKEQTLVDRGNEYARAVKLYVRKTGQYPPSFEAMENTNRMRFLRKRFKDPFTGKDDWRLLHAGPGGIIIDSKVTPVAANTANGSNGSNGLGNPNGNAPGNTGFGSSATTSNSAFGGAGNNGSANSAFGGFNSGQSPNSGSGNGNNASTGPATQNNGGFGGFNSGNGNSGASFGGYLSAVNGNTNSGMPQAPSGAAMRQRAAAIAANGAAGTAAGLTAAPGLANSSDQSLNPPTPNNSDPNANVQNGPGMQVRVGQNAPQDTGGINNQSSPFSNRPAPGANSPGLGSAAPSSSSTMGRIQSGGIAGVASLADGTGIKTVNDQSRYKLWEFVYDMTKDAARQTAGALNQTGAAAGAPNPGNTGFAQGSGTPGNSAFGNSGFGGGNSNSGFGNSNSNGFGNSNTSGFGNSSSNGFGNSNTSGFGNSNSSGFGNNSNNGFGNSNTGFGNSSTNSGNSSNNGWFTNGNNSNSSQSAPTSTTARP